MNSAKALGVIGLIAAAFALPTHAANPAAETSARLLAQAEPRIKAINETNEFRTRSFRATWLPDGSGFRKPDTYHVGIAVVPKPQAQYYNAWYQEIFMRTPKDNPEGYRTGSAINYAEGPRGDLLIITGSGESNTHVEITEGLVDRLIALGKRFDYFVYPHRDHGLSEGKGTEVHVQMLITWYLDEHLPPGPR